MSFTEYQFLDHDAAAHYFGERSEPNADTSKAIGSIVFEGPEQRVHIIGFSLEKEGRIVGAVFDRISTEADCLLIRRASSTVESRKLEQEGFTKLNGNYIKETIK